MINIFKKLILTLSLIVVVTMGLSKWGPQVTLQAEDTPTQTFTSDRIIAGGVKVDNELLSIAQHTTNMYTSIPIGSYNQYQVTFPNFTSGIDNFQIAIIESAYIIVEMSYVGSSLSGGTYSNFNFEYESTNFVSQESISPRKVQMSIDPRNYTSASFTAWLYDTRGSQYTTPTGIDGEIRIYSIRIEVKYHFDISDEISPILDGAGSLVKSKNLAKPNLSGKVLVSENTYEMCNQSGFSVTYNSVSNYFTINGTSTVQCVFFTYLVPGTYTLSYRYMSGSIDTYNGISADVSATSNILMARNSSYMNTQIGDASIVDKTIAIYVNSAATFTNLKFRIQLEVGTTATPWMHPDSIYYSTASIQHDQAPDSVSTIMSNVYAYDDVDGNITDRFQVVDTAREYAAILANKWKLNVNEVLLAYDSNTLNEVITNTIILTKAYVDTEFATYQLDTYWYALANDILVPYNLTTSYKFMAYVGDDAGNYSFLEISVFVNDATAPTFSDSNPLSIQVSYKTTYDLASWASNLIITDNVDLDVSRSIYTDNYTANKSTPGTYTVIVRAVDDTGNIKDKTYNFVVIDDIAPVFNGPESIFKPQSSTMTISDIKSRYTAYDEISGNVTSRITIFEDGYTGRGHLVGTYTVIFRVTDLVGNYTDVTVLVTVSDDIPPVIYVADGYFIQVSSAYTLTIEGIRDILVATGRLNIVSATTYQVIVNEYEGNENLPGIYTISIRFSQTSGVTEVHSVAVNVKNASTLPDGIFNPHSDNGGIVYIGLGILVVAVVIYLYRKK